MKTLNNEKTTLIGGCDITAISFYLKTNRLNIVDVNSISTFYASLSTLLEMVNHKDNNKLNPVELAIKTNIYEIKNNLIVFSVLSEPQVCVYSNKESNEHIRFGDTDVDFTKTEEGFYSELEKGYCNIKVDYNTFKKTFEYIGLIPPREVVENYKRILYRIPKTTKICILLGPTKTTHFYEMNSFFRQIDIIGYYKQLNDLFVSEIDMPNVSYIFPEEYFFDPKSKDGLYWSNFTSIVHYSRKTYHLLAKELHRRYCHNIKLSYWKPFRRFVRKYIFKKNKKFVLNRRK